MAWLGKDLVVCTALRAMLLRLPDATYSQIFALPPESPAAMLVQAIPDAQQALLLVVGHSSQIPKMIARSLVQRSPPLKQALSLHHQYQASCGQHVISKHHLVLLCKKL